MVRKDENVTIKGGNKGPGKWKAADRWCRKKGMSGILKACEYMG